MLKNKLLVVVTLPVLMCLLPSCESSSNKLPKIENHEARSVPIYLKFEDSSPVGSMIIDHFNNSSVGYVEIKSIINSGAANFPLLAEYNDHVFSVTNTHTNGSVEVDFDKQTITYNSFDRYYCINNNYVPYIDIYYLTNDNYFLFNLTESKYTSSQDKRIIDVSSYNIPLYFENNMGYVPIDFLYAIFLPFGNCAINYNGAAVYYYEIEKNNYSYLKSYYEESNIFKADYMEYTYNLLALQLDNIYGLNKKTRTDNGKEVTFLEGGAYETLKPYHDGLVSLEPNVSDNTYIRLFKEKLDDGGHTGYPSHNCLIDENHSEIQFGEELSYRLDIGNKLAEKRTAAGYSPSQIVTRQQGKAISCLHAYDEVGDTAFITFDKFTTDNAVYGTAVTKDNYYLNTLYLVNYANQRIKANTNIKNVVIDLSNNSGGEATAETFISSWLCKGSTTKSRNVKDKSYQESTIYADINFDGVFDENDYIDDDINLYCITSLSSFSCGNLLSCHLKDLTDTKFIGGNSGGGSCEVFPVIPTGLGNKFQMSNMYQLGRQSSTSYDNFVPNESGAEVDFYQIGYDDSEIAKFYDRTTILEKIHVDNA